MPADDNGFHPHHALLHLEMPAGSSWGLKKDPLRDVAWRLELRSSMTPMEHMLNRINKWMKEELLSKQNE